MHIKIRLAYPEDIPALMSLIPKSARTLQASYYTQEQIEGSASRFCDEHKYLSLNV
jgi:hypothetical protein